MGCPDSDNARDLAIQHRISDAQIFADPVRQVGKAVKHISIPGHQPAFAILDVR